MSNQQTKMLRTKFPAGNEECFSTQLFYSLILDSGGGNDNTDSCCRSFNALNVPGLVFLYNPA